MRVHVDQEKCQGHNRCVALAPSLFEIDDYGTASAIDVGLVPPELEADAALAVDNCPEFAISITDD
jgi:ferredoxin